MLNKIVDYFNKLLNNSDISIRKLVFINITVCILFIVSGAINFLLIFLTGFNIITFIINLFLTIFFIIVLFNEKILKSKLLGFLLLIFLYINIIIIISGKIQIKMGSEGTIFVSTLGITLIVSFVEYFYFNKKIGTLLAICNYFFIIITLTFAYPNLNTFLNMVTSLIIYFTLVGLFFVLKWFFDDSVNKLNKQKLIVEATLQDKEEFMAKITHEIKNPIQIIENSIELIKLEEVENEDMKSNLILIDKSTKNLETIVNDLYEIVALQANKITLKYDNFKLEELVNEVTKGFASSKVKLKGLQLETKIDPKLPSELYGDVTRIKQILYNLLSNAIKFTEKGVITIEFKETWEGYERKFMMQVKDTGIGIAEKDQRKIFDSFEQINNESLTNDMFQGLGLGLTIIRELTKLMNGRIILQSEWGKGSTIMVILPLIDYKLGN